MIKGTDTPRLVLGVDPGNNRCGWGVVAKEGGSFRLVESGCLGTPAGTERGVRLLCVYEGLRQVIGRLHPEELSIEKLYFNRNVTSAISVAEARGVAILAAAQAGVPVFEYTPAQIKLALTGKGRADKLQVEMMVMMLLKLQVKPRPDDVSDAIAIALTRIFYSELIAV